MNELRDPGSESLAAIENVTQDYEVSRRRELRFLGPIYRAFRRVMGSIVTAQVLETPDAQLLLNSTDPIDTNLETPTLRQQAELDGHVLHMDFTLE